VPTDQQVDPEFVNLNPFPVLVQDERGGNVRLPSFHRRAAYPTATFVLRGEYYRQFLRPTGPLSIKPSEAPSGVAAAFPVPSTPVPAAASPPADAGEGGDAGGSVGGEDGGVDPDEGIPAMTVLKEIAAEYGIRGRSKMSREELYDALVAEVGDDVIGEWGSG